MARLLIALSLIAAFLLSPRLTIGAVPPLSISTLPDGGFINQTWLEVSVRIEKHKGNRLLLYGLECIDTYNASEIHITEKTETAFRTRYVNLEAGECVAFAILHRDEKGKIKEFIAVSPVIRILEQGAPAWLGA